MTTLDSEPLGNRRNEFLGHPKGLFVLFGAEMWERFSYYGMRALLVLYLTNHLKFDEPRALDIYATYTGLVYLTPLLGGYLADRALGQRKAVLIGGILMALGHFAMAFEPLLNLALGLLILGNGFFKPNISTIVGRLYPPGDPRRDGGYTIFYMGINLGATMAPLVCGRLGQSASFGWHYGFAAAGVGMVLGLLNFAIWQGTLGPIGFPEGRKVDPSNPRLDGRDLLDVVAISAIGALLIGCAIAIPPAIRSFVPAAAFAPIVLAAWGALAAILVAVAIAVASLGKAKADARREIKADQKPATPSQKDPYINENDSHDKSFTKDEIMRLIVIVTVGLLSVMFWMGFEQAGGTLNLFADQKTRLEFLGIKFVSSMFQAINPLFILLFAPLFSLLWTVLDRRGLGINSAAKMGLGLILLGVGFGVMAAAEGAAAGSSDRKVGPEWLTIFYLFSTFGELCLSPIGLSLVNKLAPARVSSLMMAFWFLCTAIANYLAGNLKAMLVHYDVNLWVFLIGSSAGTGLLLTAASPFLNRLSGKRL